MDVAHNINGPNISSLLVTLPSIATSPTAGSIQSHASELANSVEVSSSSSWLGLLGRMILPMARVIPGILYWIITFATITLPTVLFTLFSTSLTFTMNMTTL